MIIKLKAPKNYSEMSLKQIRYVATLQLAGLSQEAIWAKCFFKFTNLKIIDTIEDSCIVKWHKDITDVNTEDINELIQKFSWITSSYIGVNPPQRLGKLQPYQSLFQNLKFESYLEAENELQAYIFTQKDIHLVNLIAILYYSKNDTLLSLEKKIQYFEKKSNTDKMIVLMWVLGVKEFFTQKFKLLFAHDGSTSDDKAQAPDMYKIMQNQIRALTGGDITKREAVLQSLTWDALEELENKIKESKEIAKS